MSSWRGGPPSGGGPPGEPPRGDEPPGEPPWDDDDDGPGHDPELEDDDAEGLAERWAEEARWPLTWRELYPRERWMWFEQLWKDVCALRGRYRISVRSGWWEDELQLELLAALAAWVQRFDSGEWDDPPGKLALLYDLERVNAMLRDGLSPFDPRRDHPAFISHIVSLGAKPPPEWGRERR